MAKNIVDFDALAYFETSKFTAKHPNGTVLGTINVAGPAHQQILEFEEEENRRLYDEEQSTTRERYEAVRTGAEVPPANPYKTTEHKRHIIAKKLASYVVSADFKIKFKGESVEFNRETAERIFKDPSFGWLVSPFWNFVNSIENFTPNSADNS